MRLGATEILLILLVVLVVFGGKRLGGVGKALGTSIREFKKEVGSDDKTEEGSDISGKSNAQNTTEK